MIKQSFLRNYNLTKLYSQAEDQKRKLQVFYARQVEKIIKQRRLMDRKFATQMTCKQHRKERLRVKQTLKMMKENRYSQDKQSLRTTKMQRKQTDKDESNQSQQKKKADLFVTNLSLKSCVTSEDSKHQSLKITTVPNRNFHKKMLESIMLKLKEENGFLLQYDSKKQNLIEKLKKRKNNTNPSMYYSSENFNLERQHQCQNKTSLIKIINKFRLKRTQTSKVLVKTAPTQNQIAISVIKNPKFGMKYVNQLEFKGLVIKRKESSQI